MIKRTVNVDRGVKGTSVLSLAMNKTEATQPTSVLPVAQKARPRVSSVLVFHQNTRTRERKHTWLLEKPKESVQLSVAELKSNWEVFSSLDSSFSSWFKSHFVIACFQVITDVNHFHGEDKVWSIFDCHYEGGVSVWWPQPRFCLCFCPRLPENIQWVITGDRQDCPLFSNPPSHSLFSTVKLHCTISC